MENTIRITAGELRNFYTDLLAKLDFDTARRRIFTECFTVILPFFVCTIVNEVTHINN